jgi:hypothetical protein
MLITDGLGMPDSLLKGSPFSSFAAPALILFVIIGAPTPSQPWGFCGGGRRRCPGAPSPGSR